MRIGAPETMNGPRRTLRGRLLSPGGVRALATAVWLLAAGMAVAPAAAASGSTYSGGVNPTYTGSGAEPVTESACQQFSNGAGGCEFATANQDHFTISVPNGFVLKYQGTATLTGNNMAVIAAVVRDLNPAKYAEGGVSGIPFDVSVSPSYAAKLATVGVTPTQFLDWMFANVPANERAPWVPGSAFSAPAAATTTTPPPSTAASRPASSVPATASATKAPGGTTAPASKASAPKPSHPAPVVPKRTATVYPTTTTPLPASRVSAEKASATASGTGGSGTAVPTSSTVNPGGVIANPADCPAGESAAVEPQGAVCIPDGPLGVPLHPGPKPVPSVWSRAMRALVAWLAPVLPYWSLIAMGVILLSLPFVGAAIIRKISS